MPDDCVPIGSVMPGVLAVSKVCTGHILYTQKVKKDGIYRAGPAAIPHSSPIAEIVASAPMMAFYISNITRLLTILSNAP
jgi:hypothetical protein